MRMIFVMITGISLIFTISVGWYLSNTVVLQIVAVAHDSITSTQQGENLLGLVEWVNVLWGAVLIILVVVWMIASAQQRDVESELYG